MGTGLGSWSGLFGGAGPSCQALSSEGVTEFVVPVTRLVVITVMAGMAGVLAATGPARRAARLDILEAISTE